MVAPLALIPEGAMPDVNEVGSTLTIFRTAWPTWISEGTSTPVASPEPELPHEAAIISIAGTMANKDFAILDFIF